MWPAAILAVLKAFPPFKEIFLQTVDLYQAAMDAAATNQSIKVQREREAIVAAMKQPGLTDENRAVLRRRLWELSKL